MYRCDTLMLHTSLMKRQVVITHTILQTEILEFLDSWVKNTSSVKMLCPQQIAYFRKSVTCLILLVCRESVNLFLTPVKLRVD
jgi:hypothetical protein